MWDWSKFWSDIQGPVTQALLTLLLALIAALTAFITYYGQRFMAAKSREQEAKTETAKLESVSKLADVIVPAIEQKSTTIPQSSYQKKNTATEIINRNTPSDISMEIVDHVVERKVAEGNAELVNPPQKIEADV